MDAAHIHLFLNHVPVLGAVFGLLVLGYGLARKDADEVLRVGLWTLVVVGLAGAAVYLTGESAEELVEGLPGVSEAILERHEEAALWAAVGGGLVGAVALAVLLWYRGRSVPRRIGGATFLLALALTGVMGWTANLGGQVRHTEIRPDASAAASAEVGEQGPEGEEAGGHADEEHEER